MLCLFLLHSAYNKMEPAQRVSRLSVYFSVLFVLGFLTKSATACSEYSEFSH